MDDNNANPEQVAEALRQSEARYRRIVANAPGMVYQFARRVDGSVTFPYVSTGSLALFGVDPQRIMDDPLALVGLVHPDDMGSFLQTVETSARTLGEWKWEGRFVLGSGETRWIGGASHPEQEANGDVLWDGLLLDITPTKTAEESLRLQNEYFAALHETTLVLMQRLDLEDLLEHLAARAGRMLNAPHGYIYLVTPDSEYMELRVGLGIGAAFRGHQMRKAEGVAGRVWESGQTCIVNDYKAWSGHVADFDTTPLRAIMAAPLLSGGQIAGVIGLGYGSESQQTFGASESELLNRFAQLASIALDNARLYTALQTELGERKRVEAALTLAKEEAETADRAKSQFLANMSHELRTPLNAIIGYSEMLQEDATDAGQEEIIPDLQKINSAGKHLLTLINDVLDLSKIEAGKMELYVETFDVAAMIQEVVSAVRPLAQKNGNTLNAQCRPDVGAMRADLTKVRQSLFNLISNAAKFTGQGRITLDAKREADMGEWIVFQVSDTGIGMTREQMDRLFQAFAQADASTTRKYGGTGLGLAITRHFCEMMGGAITLESVVGVGTTFTIRLPTGIHAEFPAVEALPAETTDARTRLESVKKPAAILVIDDDAAARNMMRDALTNAGYRVECAASGEEGLRLARKIHPIAITLDVMMPRMDGWAVLSAMKADPELAHIPVVMMTLAEDSSMGYSLGAADYLTKPVEPLRLAAILDKFRAHPSVKTVLVVEDNVPTRQMLRQMLQKAGWRVLEAENGRVGLERVAEHLPDLILLDLMMPEMDGFEFTAEMRGREEWSAIPIIVITAKDITSEDRHRLEGRVTQLLQKGTYNHQALIGRIRELLRSDINA